MVEVATLGLVRDNPRPVVLGEPQQEFSQDKTVSPRTVTVVVVVQVVVAMQVATVVLYAAVTKAALQVIMDLVLEMSPPIPVDKRPEEPINHILTPTVTAVETAVVQVVQDMLCWTCG